MIDPTDDISKVGSAAMMSLAVNMDKFRKEKKIDDINKHYIKNEVLGQG